jgi:hypothetical protein
VGTALGLKPDQEGVEVGRAAADANGELPSAMLLPPIAIGVAAVCVWGKKPEVGAGADAVCIGVPDGVGAGI